MANLPSPFAVVGSALQPAGAGKTFDRRLGQQYRISRDRYSRCRHRKCTVGSSMAAVGTGLCCDSRVIALSITGHTR